jgi:hypothetical protein
VALLDRDNRFVEEHALRVPIEKPRTSASSGANRHVPVDPRSA